MLMGSILGRRRGWSGRWAAMIALAAAVGGVWQPARAQLLERYLNPTAPGFDLERGAVIPQRPRTEYDPLGVRLGDVVIRSQLDESVGYDTNVLGSRPSVGSWRVGTAPSVTVNSDFGRNAFGASFGLSDQRFLDQRQENRTDWNAAVNGSLDIGRDKLSLSLSESLQHLTPTSLDSGSITVPVGFKVTDAAARYTTSLARLQFEPNLEYVGYRFDDTTLAGTNISQKVHDRDVFVGGLTTRYGNWPERNLLLVTRAIDSQYIADLGGLPRPNSIGYEALVGGNYAFSGNLQALALVGYEVRRFSNSVYRTRSSPVAQLSVIWTPTGLTTLTARGVRSIEDSLGESTTGVTVTQGNITIDHEYQRNWLLQGRGAVSNAEYGQGIGHENLFSLGAGVTYLVNRNLHVIGSYDFTVRTGTSGSLSVLPFQTATSLNFGDYNRHIALVTLRFAL